MSAHTPGPWVWAKHFCGLYGAGPDNAVLAYYSYEGMHLGANEKANAALIASAPDAYDALRQWAWAEANGDEAELANARRSRDAAIAKAEGRE